MNKIGVVCFAFIVFVCNFKISSASLMTLDEAVDLAVKRQNNGTPFDAPLEPEWKRLFDRNMTMAKKSPVLKTNPHLLAVIETIEAKGHQYFETGTMTNQKFTMLNCMLALMFSPENCDPKYAPFTVKHVTDFWFLKQLLPEKIVETCMWFYCHGNMTPLAILGQEEKLYGFEIAAERGFNTCFTKPEEAVETFMLFEDVLARYQKLTDQELLKFVNIMRLEITGKPEIVMDPTYELMIEKMRKTPLAHFLAHLIDHRCLYLPFVARLPYSSFASIPKLMGHRITFVGIPTQNCDYDRIKNASPAGFAFHDFRDHAVGYLDYETELKDLVKSFSPTLESDPFCFRLKRLAGRIESLEKTEKTKALFGFYLLFHEHFYKFKKDIIVFGVDSFNPGQTPEEYYSYFLAHAKVDHGPIKTKIVHKWSAWSGKMTNVVQVCFTVDPSQMIFPYGQAALRLGTPCFLDMTATITSSLDYIGFDSQTNEVLIDATDFKTRPNGDGTFQICRRTMEKDGDYRYLKKHGAIVLPQDGRDLTSYEFTLFQMSCFASLLKAFSDDDPKPTLVWPETLWDESGIIRK